MNQKKIKGKIKRFTCQHHVSVHGVGLGVWKSLFKRGLYPIVFKILVFAPDHHDLAVQDSHGPERIRIVELFRLEMTLKIIQCCLIPGKKLLNGADAIFWGLKSTNPFFPMNFQHQSVSQWMFLSLCSSRCLWGTRRMWRPQARCLPMWITRNMGHPHALPSMDPPVLSPQLECL